MGLAASSCTPAAWTRVQPGSREGTGLPLGGIDVEAGGVIRPHSVAAGAGGPMKGMGIGKSLLRVLSHITMSTVGPTTKPWVCPDSVGTFSIRRGSGFLTIYFVIHQPRNCFIS